jgi:hypothetical protein
MKSRVVLVDDWLIRRIGRLLFCDRLQMRRVRDTFYPGLCSLCSLTPGYKYFALSGLDRNRF